MEIEMSKETRVMQTSGVAYKNVITAALYTNTCIVLSCYMCMWSMLIVLNVVREWYKFMYTLQKGIT